MGDCHTFREELAIKYPLLGHALWDPDPGGRYDAVQVGDVGLIREGCFHRIFNALLPKDHPSNPHPHESLNYPEQLKPVMPDHIRKSRSFQNVFRSKNITQVTQEPSNVFALGPDDYTQVTFSCSTRQGALIWLPFPTECVDTVARGDFRKWIVNNIDDCMKLADDLGWGVNRMEDIILVTGRHLTKSWVNVAFSESRGGAQVSFGVRVTGASNIHLEQRNMAGGELKLGPHGGSLPENQCIFVRGYRVARILNIWPRLQGLAGPAPDIHEPEPESDTRVESQCISIPADINHYYRDPLHILLDYMAEEAPDCEFALVHDDDLDYIVVSSLPADNLQPDTLKGHIKNRAPDIFRQRFELTRDSKSEKAAGAEITIASIKVPKGESPPSAQYDIPSGLIKQVQQYTSTRSQYPTGSAKYNTASGHITQVQQYTSTRSQYPPGPRRMFHLIDLAYAKIILHALKYSHQTVNGVLLGPTPTPGAAISVSDAVPLQHHWTNLSPMMEVGLGMTAGHAHSNHLHVVGYYEAPARVGDTALSQVGERVVSRIKATFPTPVALVLDGSRLEAQNGAALVPYVPVASIFRRAEDRFTFNRSLPARVLRLIRHSSILDQFWDFDDYLENDRVPFLINGAVQTALNSLQ